eukprot:3274144-Prymnesium_polylepis.1
MPTPLSHPMRLAFLTPRVSCCPRCIHADVSGSESRPPATHLRPQAPSALLRLRVGGSAAPPNKSGRDRRTSNRADGAHGMLVMLIQLYAGTEQAHGGHSASQHKPAPARIERVT